MERKTKVEASDNSHAIHITREFDLPVDLLFKAYTTPEILEQWMGTKVLRLENQAHGGYQFETTDPKGNKHRFNGVIHSLSPDRSITRTFEMENTPFPVQLEFLEFESLGEDRSLLKMQIICRSVADRDAILKLPFAAGISMAHDRLQQVAATINEAS